MEEKLNELLAKLNQLESMQVKAMNEISSVKKEINALKLEWSRSDFSEENVVKEEPESRPIQEVVLEEDTVLEPFKDARSQIHLEEKPLFRRNKEEKRTDLEKFIGENLINKVGIIITIIGVVIGAKYAIEHDLISPLTRIVLGYLVGLGLLAFALKLKEKYESFSAVLLSGAMTILYFITYVAYDLYHLFPQVFAFILMLLFTVFTVVAALNYNKQIIAHIGLVGSYAIPFLLSNDSGRAEILFGYMVIINIGILIISFKRYWKSMYYVSFGFTWLIYLVWYASEFRFENHFTIALTFAILFFLIFYMAFMAYKLLKREEFKIGDVILLLLNSFVFYAIGYALLDSHPEGNSLQGLFALLNAVVHFAVSYIIFKNKLADRKIFYLISGLVLVFLTAAIPIQLDGNWVTLLWVLEATVLFWIGRTKNVPIYEYLSYPILLLASFSLFDDWSHTYRFYEDSVSIPFLFNIHFLSSLLFVSGLGAINYVNRRHSGKESLGEDFTKILNYILPIAFIGILYFAFQKEIGAYWDQRYLGSSTLAKIGSDGDSYTHTILDSDLRDLKHIWLVIYTLGYLTLLSFVNLRKWKNKSLGTINLVMNAIGVFLFLLIGLFALSELRESYLDNINGDYFDHGSINIWIRYIGLSFLAGLIYSIYKYYKEMFPDEKMRMAFDCLLHVSILWVLSSELLHWLDFVEFTKAYKLVLSILWGVYSLGLVSYGMYKKKKPLRIGAIALFGFTLIKLFFYDLVHLNTISKTIVLVSLGVLLLIISFLYNKFKNTMYEEK